MYPVQKLNTVVKVLNKTIKNPAYDRRCKYGDESIKEVEEGARMIVDSYRYTDCNDFIKYEVRLLGIGRLGITRIRSNDFCDLLNANSTITAPSTIDFMEIAALRGFDTVVTAPDIINIMLREGLVKVDAVITALDAYPR
jgi:hypothetical protein